MNTTARTTIRRITIRNDQGHTIIEIPVTAGVAAERTPTIDRAGISTVHASAP